MKKKVLFLLPNLLYPSSSIENIFSPKVKEIVKDLDGLIAESEKGAREYLFHFLTREQITKIPIYLLNEHTQKEEIFHLLSLLIKGGKWGLVSDCGLPILADPGSELVLLAREKNIQIKAISGPSSIFLSLMLSGLPSQRFFFHGYLPRKEEILKKKIKEIEKLSLIQKATQIFIETPYRVDKLLKILLDVLKDSTYLCLAENISFPSQRVETKKISLWKKKSFKKGKRPAVFLLYGGKDFS